MVPRAISVLARPAHVQQKCVAPIVVLIETQQRKRHPLGNVRSPLFEGEISGARKSATDTR